MCTVTFVPTLKGFIFTSNRDEQTIRKTLPPAYYKEDDVRLFYPKDVVAGGSWIGVSGHDRLVCLLNGGGVYHNPKLKYAKSRGLVVKILLTTKNLEETLGTINLEGIAPFTLIIVDWQHSNKLYELIWCQGKKHVNMLSDRESYIWSSSTLYTSKVKVLRQKWFSDHVLLGAKINKKSILEFHQNEELGGTEISPKMKRLSVETISTTMVVKDKETLSMDYYDYNNNSFFEYKNLFANVKVLFS